MSMHLGSSSDMLSQGSGNWWSRKSPSEKRHFLVASVTSILAFALAIGIISIGKRPREVFVYVNNVERLCGGDICDKYVKDLDTRNITVEPCEDFYDYVCGKFNDIYPIPEDALISTYMSNNQKIVDNEVSSVLSVVYSLIKDKTKRPPDAQGLAAILYGSCLSSQVNNNSSDFFVDLMNEFLSGWPIITPGWKESFSGLSKAMELKSQFRFNSLMSLDVYPDFSGTSKYIIMIVPSSSVTSRSPKKLSAIAGASYTQLLTFIHDLACYLYPDCNTIADLDENINKTVEFKFRLDKALLDRVQKLSLSKLDEKVPLKKGGDWATLINLALKESTVKVKPETEVLVAVEFLTEIVKLSEEDDKATANYLGWSILSNLGPIISKTYREIQFKNFEKKLGVQALMTDEEHCSKEVSSLMPFAAAEMYNRFLWGKNQKEKNAQAEKMIKVTKETITEIFQQSSWIRKETKDKLITKLNAMNSFVSCPAWIKDESQLNNYYKDVDISEDGSSFGEQARQVMMSNWKNIAENIGKDFDRSKDWIPQGLDIMKVNAWNSPMSNTIHFPQVLLKYPFYEFNVPRSVSYASLGFIIAHEIFHGFGLPGIYFNDVGYIRNNIFNPDEAKEFESKQKCLIDQYNSIILPGGQKLNGNITLDENIADNSGIKAAFKISLKLSGVW